MTLNNTLILKNQEVNSNSSTT